MDFKADPKRQIAGTLLVIAVMTALIMTAYLIPILMGITTSDTSPSFWTFFALTMGLSITAAILMKLSEPTRSRDI